MTPHDVVPNVLDSEIVKIRFDLHSCKNFHFQIDTHGKVLNALLPQLGFNNSTTLLLQGLFQYWITHEGWYSIKKETKTIVHSFVAQSAGAVEYTDCFSAEG